MPDLFEIIDSAFTDVPYPGDDHLTFTDEADREFDETWNVLRGKDWRQMPVEEFMQGDTPDPSLTPKALHYYLPALLKASLTGDSGGGVIGDLVFFLNPAQTRRCCSWENGAKQKFEEFRSLLTEPQLNAFRAVIRSWRRRGFLGDDEYRDFLEAYFEPGTEPETVPDRVAPAAASEPGRPRFGSNLLSQLLLIFVVAPVAILGALSLLGTYVIPKYWPNFPMEFEFLPMVSTFFGNITHHFGLECVGIMVAVAVGVFVAGGKGRR